MTTTPTPHDDMNALLRRRPTMRVLRTTDGPATGEQVNALLRSSRYEDAPAPPPAPERTPVVPMGGRSDPERYAEPPSMGDVLRGVRAERRTRQAEETETARRLRVQSTPPDNAA